ncbi:16660_t:CDS:2 [Entrophospora sp. SA101]|nr:16660_t:CDS:2 [Entrophospora sp. SA101]
MFEYITQTFSYISNVPKSLNDSRNPFKAGDLVEVREEINKYYTTDKINNFIKEIEEIKAESTQDNS